MKGGCACGAVAVLLARLPEYVNFCDCTLCRKAGAAWGYLMSDEVEITGPTRAFRRTDLPDPSLDLNFCPDCGATVSWTPVGERPPGRMGVNLRLFDEAELTGIEARFPDGRNWVDERPAARCAPLVMGERPLP